MADRGTQPDGFSGGRGPSLPAGLRSQSAKGAALIVLAVIVGIVLLQIVDPGKSGPVGARPPASSTSTTSTTTKPNGSTTSTTAKAATVKPPAQLHLLVLNSGAPTGSAAHVSTNLKNNGYTNQGTAGNNATHVVGTQVLCLAAQAGAAARIVTLLGQGTTSGPLVAPLPTGAAGYDCVVLVGSG